MLLLNTLPHPTRYEKQTFLMHDCDTWYGIYQVFMSWVWFALQVKFVEAAGENIAVSVVLPGPSDFQFQRSSLVPSIIYCRRQRLLRSISCLIVMCCLRCALTLNICIFIVSMKMKIWNREECGLTFTAYQSWSVKNIGGYGCRIIDQIHMSASNCRLGLTPCFAIGSCYREAVMGAATSGNKKYAAGHRSLSLNFECLLIFVHARRAWVETSVSLIVQQVFPWHR